MSEENITMPQAVESVPVPSETNAPLKIAFIGSECYPFVKTGGLGDVMYALPRALIREECIVQVILPLYRCIPQKYVETWIIFQKKYRKFGLYSKKLVFLCRKKVLI